MELGDYEALSYLLSGVLHLVLQLWFKARDKGQTLKPLLYPSTWL